MSSMLLEGHAMALLRTAMVTACGTRPGELGRAGVAALANLLNRLDPAVMSWNLELAEAAVLLFGTAGTGPTQQALEWLRYAQRTATVLVSPLSPLSCEASAHLGRRCQQAGNPREAAAAWEVVTLGMQQRDQWQNAHQARLHWASNLHRSGACDDAVHVLRHAWDQRATTHPRGPLTIAITCLQLLELCGRQEEETAFWSAMPLHSTPAENTIALDALQSYAASSRRSADLGAHTAVCGYRGSPAAITLPAPSQRRRPAPPPLGIGGCGHG